MRTVRVPRLRRFWGGALAALCLLSLATGCRTGRPDYTVAVPPHMADIRPVKSVLFVESPISLAPLSAQIDAVVGRLVPAGRGGQLRMGLIDIGYRLLRQPLSVVAAPPGLQLRMPLLGDLNIGAGFLHCATSGVGGNFTIGLRPTLDANGALMLRDAQIGVAPLGQIACAGLSIPVPNVFSGILDPISRALTAALQQFRLPFGPQLSAGLAQLSTARSLNLGGQRACLDLAPSALVIAPPTAGGSPGELGLKLGVEVAPRLSLGPCPPAGTPLQPAALSVKEAALGDDFHVVVAVAIPATQIESLLRPQLVGKRLGGSGGGVTVRAMQVGDASGRMLIKLDVAGDYTGAIYLWGTPQVATEAGRQILRVPDLRLAAESESLIQDMRLSLLQLWEGDLAARLREKLVLDVTQRLEDLRAQLSGTLTFEGQEARQAASLVGAHGVVLTAQIAQVAPQAVVSQPGVIVVHTLLSGRLQLRFQ